MRVGSLVLAAYWDKNHDPYGWWLALVTGINKTDVVIKWCDEPKTPAFKIERKYIAILHPAYLASGG